jgi:hypothetical protein
MRKSRFLFGASGSGLKMEGKVPLIGEVGFEEEKEYTDAAAEMGDEGVLKVEEGGRTALSGVILTIVQRIDIREDQTVKVKHTSRR